MVCAVVAKSDIYGDNDIDGDDDEFTDGDAFVPRVLSAQHIDVLPKCKDALTLAALSASNSADMLPTIGSIAMEILDQRIAEAEDPRMTGNVCSTEDLVVEAQFPALETRLRLVTSALSDVEWIDPAEHPGETPPLQACPSLLDISRSFSLNRKQHKALVKFGSKLLESFTLDANSDQQLVGFLGGKPGAGKSQVIHALQMLAQMWGNPGAVATGAYQGIAAQNADGQTIHKLFGWRVNSDQSKWKPTNELIERFIKVKLLIIDEISTCDVHILGRIDTSLRIILKRPLLRFGGLNVLLVGDSLQPLPVAGQPAYLPIPRYIISSTANETRDSAMYLDRVRGTDAYQHVNAVVMLSENKRHKSGPVWRDILDRWRVGEYLQADVDLINDICYKRNYTCILSYHRHLKCS